MESAGVTLVKGDLAGIVRARKLSQATMRKSIKTCFRVSLQFARGADCRWSAVSVFRGPVKPDSCGGGDELSSVSVITNSLRLRKLKL